jgi:cytochrome o ubiquinol oxidase subunit 1
MGAGADVNAFFGVMTIVIAVPTGVKVFNWLFTLYGGRVRFEPPLLWALGFICTFVIGGMTGVLLAIPPADFVLHNSLFLVAHFHNVIIGGVLFGMFAGYTYWFPKAFGFELDRRLGIASFWCWLVGFYLAFMPLYVLGLLGATRRMQHYAEKEWQPLMLVAMAGALVILAGIVLMGLQLYVSIRRRDVLRDRTGDPWNGRTLEWSIPSPPPPWNFTTLPQVQGTDAYWGMKQAGKQAAVEARQEPHHEAIHLPRSSAVGVTLAFFSSIGGFALVWHIWWLAIVCFIGVLVAALAHGWIIDREVHVPEAEIAAFEQAHRRPTA